MLIENFNNFLRCFGSYKVFINVAKAIGSYYYFFKASEMGAEISGMIINV